MKFNDVRNEMLKCAAGCSVGILTSNGVVYLVWNITNEMHTEKILTSDCFVGNANLMAALSRAKESLIH